MAQHQRKNAGLQVITANRLIDGVVVYWSGTSGSATSGWSEDLGAALVLSAADAKQEQAKVDGASVVDVYFFEINDSKGVIIPASVRERIRATGPTVRLDLGKQAGG